MLRGRPGAGSDGALHGRVVRLDAGHVREDRGEEAGVDSWVLVGHVDLGWAGVGVETLVSKGGFVLQGQREVVGQAT